jgi:hypothetical protein
MKLMQDHPQAPFASAGLGSLDHQNVAMIAIVLIIIFTGTFGGTAAFLAERRMQPTSTALTDRPRWATFVVLGIVAAASVPFFLSILKSELTIAIFRQPLDAVSYDSYLVFAGLCLVAAFSARRFMETVTEQLLRKVDRAETSAAQASAAATEASEVAHEAIKEIEAADEADRSADLATDQEAAPEQFVAGGDDVPSREGGTDTADPQLTMDERKVLQAMERRTYRTASGIAQDSGIPRHRISELLESLADKTLVLPTKSPRTGGARWAISRRGAKALRATG